MLPKSIQQLVLQFKKLPGIGPKSAERIAFYLIQQSKEDLYFFSESIKMAKEGIELCSRCFHLAQKDHCPICDDPNRDQSIICVVETIQDLLSIERMGSYSGVYHILHGKIDPLHHIGPEHLRLKELGKRVYHQKVQEIILATNPDVEGETTALYISRMLEGNDIKITRIARGIPVGGNVEFSDDMTLKNALEGRTVYQ